MHTHDAERAATNFVSNSIRNREANNLRVASLRNAHENIARSLAAA